MPMINLKDKQGNMKWIYVMPFRSLKAARLYAMKSLTNLRIIKAGEHIFWLCEPQDADWAVKNGYKELKKNKGMY